MNEERKQYFDRSKSATVSKRSSFCSSNAKKSQNHHDQLMPSRPHRNTRPGAHNKETTTTTVVQQQQRNRLECPEEDQDLIERAKRNIERQRQKLATARRPSVPNNAKKSTVDVKMITKVKRQNRQRRSSAPEPMMLARIQKRVAFAQDMPDRASKSDARQLRQCPAEGVTQTAKSIPNVKTANKKSQNKQRRSSLPEPMMLERMQKRVTFAQDLADTPTSKSDARQPYQYPARGVRRPSGSRYRGVSYPQKERFGSSQKIAESVRNQRPVARNKNLPTRTP
eukprot:CAMPEP_0116864428 /NCGR_PEP_ID=MMETSP0418-20121206/24814_1 /TAXON_ID=1158023 /ORGANISM="Astrosyne radiata, Strain 13vi08-1A" /LENGTH=281 /DNA_ID=CAMNT_0004499643 /DNA_START=1574 /DNA_END=2419 /DNA_ORIENTATION=-